MVKRLTKGQRRRRAYNRRYRLEHYAEIKRKRSTYRDAHWKEIASLIWSGSTLIRRKWRSIDGRRTLVAAGFDGKLANLRKNGWARETEERGDHFDPKVVFL